MATFCPDCEAAVIGRRYLGELTFVEIYACCAVYAWGVNAKPILRCTDYITTGPAEVMGLTALEELTTQRDSAIARYDSLLEHGPPPGSGFVWVHPKFSQPIPMTTNTVNVHDVANPLSPRLGDANAVEPTPQ